MVDLPVSIQPPTLPTRGARLARPARWPTAAGHRLCAWQAMCMALALAMLLWAPASLAGEGRVLEKAFVLDPSGSMTLEQAQARPLTPYVGHFDTGFDVSPAWVRLRVAPVPPPDGSEPGWRAAHGFEKLRLVPLWASALAVYDPLQRGPDGRITPIDLSPSADASEVHIVDLPTSAEARDVWIRFVPSGPSLLAAEVLSVEASATRHMWDAMVESVAIGMLSVLLIVGAVGWWVDAAGIGRALFLKQLLNLALALQAASLLHTAGLAEALDVQAPTALQVGLLRVLNQVVSLWFLIKVLELFQSSPWAQRVLRLLLMAVAANGVFLLFGQAVLFRLMGASLHLLTLLVLLACGFAWPVRTPSAGGRLGMPLRLAQQLGLGFLMALTWIGSFVSGFYKTSEPSALALLVPVPIVGAIGVLLILGLRRMREDSLRRQQAQRATDLREQALVLERAERQRQQEFMVMLTHELKAPLSTLGMVLSTPTASDSMRRHAGLALASMRQVIDHCAQSAEFEEAEAPPSREACSLWVEVELRHAALAEHARVQLDPDPGLPVLQTDRRMLTVIVNNLLENALRYSPPGSPVQVSVGRDTSPRGAFQWLRVSNAVLEGPLPDASRLFQKYYRGAATRRSSGSGLGLYLSRLLARRMDGDLVYMGSARTVSFTLRLPE